MCIIYFRNQTEVVPTTPTPRLVMKVGHPAMVPVGTTMLRNKLEMSLKEPRVDSQHVIAGSDSWKKDIKLIQTTIQTVRINGTDIRDITKTKKECVTPKHNSKKTKKPSRSSTIGQNTPSSSKITQYLTVFEQNKTKKTLNKIETRKNVSQKINMFQGLGRGQECVKGSGRCATHNCRLVREIKNKKTSNLDKNGKVIWQMCEVTISVCPAAHTKQTDSANIQAVANSPSSAGKNKKQRLLRDYVEDQSASLTQSTDKNATIPLDKNTW